MLSEDKHDSVLEVSVVASLLRSLPAFSDMMLDSELMELLEEFYPKTVEQGIN